MKDKIKWLLGVVLLISIILNIWTGVEWKWDADELGYCVTQRIELAQKLNQLLGIQPKCQVEGNQQSIDRTTGIYSEFAKGNPC